MSHIFSSPAASPQRHGDKTLASGDMLLQESKWPNHSARRAEEPGNLRACKLHANISLIGSAPDVDSTLHSRRTPRLPPPRASTPKHTNIGSPKRMSTGRPISRRLSVDLLADGSPARPRTLPANRVLDFGAADTVHKSIEAASPFKPKRTLRRSVGPGGPSLEKTLASPEQDTKIATQLDEELQGDVAAEADAEAEVDEDVKPADDGPILMDDDDAYYEAPQQPSPIEEDRESEQMEPPQTTPSKRKPGRPRKSGDSIVNSQLSHSSSEQSRKRGRAILDEGDVSAVQMESERAAPPQKRRRGRPSKDKSVIVHQDDGDVAIDPSLLAHGDEYAADAGIAQEEAAEAEDEVPELPVKGRGKGKGKGKGKAPQERDANRKMKSSSVQINDSPSKYRGSRGPSRGGSVGPVSNVHLRATTPFEDANERTSRYGRNLIQPLKYWANESRIYKHGELEGIVRADEVEVPKKRTKRRAKKIKKGISKLDDVEEDSETESVLPDEWEEDVGVIAGQIATWDPETQMGDPDNLVKEGTVYLPCTALIQVLCDTDSVQTLPLPLQPSSPATWPIPSSSTQRS